MGKDSEMNEPVAYVNSMCNDYIDWKADPMSIDGQPLYTHPVKEQSTNERIEMLKEMVEKSANPAGWIGYHEGHLVSFLQTQEQVDSFLKNTDTAGRAEPVYTHPVKELTDEEIIQINKEEGTCWDVPDRFAIQLARAILRKAQEK
jgi:hypothetical protein